VDDVLGLLASWSGLRTPLAPTSRKAAEGKQFRIRSDSTTLEFSSAQETLTFLKRARAAELLDLRTYYRLTNRTSVTHAMLTALIRKLGDE
jgi:hypothetical protein